MINILEIVNQLQHDLHSRGINYLKNVRQVNNNIMITCPYHKNGQESTPSCGILLRDRTHTKTHKAGTVHCFTCGETHSLEEMISHVYGFDDRGHYGKQWLLESFGILSTDDIVFDYNFEIAQPTHEVDYLQFVSYHPYFATRNISEKVASAFKLGYDPHTDAVVLPLFDKQGKCIMLIKRSIRDKQYMNSTGASKTDSVFGIQMVYEKLDKLKNEEYIFVVEGAFDALRLWQNGFPAVGILQASVSDNQVDLIRKLPFDKVVIATDNDHAGREVAYKLADKLSTTKQVYLMVYPRGRKDVGEMTDKEIRGIQVEPYKDLFSF